MKIPGVGRFFLFLVLLLFLFGLIFAPSEDKFDDHLIKILELKPGMIVADIGAGKGELSYRLARAVGPWGHVYVNEIKPELIHRIKKGKQKRGLENITTVLGKQDDPLLPIQVDLILLKYVYHHLAQPHEFMVHTRKYLKAGGRLAIVAGDIHSRPKHKRKEKPKDPCISDPQKTRTDIEKAGYIFEKKGTLQGKRVLNYVLIFKAEKEIIGN